MSNSILIHQYLDEGLNDVEEDLLFKELHENKEFRDEFYTMVKLESIAGQSTSSTIVPLSVTESVFQNIGVSLPSAVIGSQGGKTATTLFTSMLGSTLFTNYRDYLIAFIGLLIGGILSSSLFLLTSKYSGHTSYSSIERNIEHNKEPYFKSNGDSQKAFVMADGVKQDVKNSGMRDKDLKGKDYAGDNTYIKNKMFAVQGNSNKYLLVSNSSEGQVSQNTSNKSTDLLSDLNHEQPAEQNLELNDINISNIFNLISNSSELIDKSLYDYNNRSDMSIINILTEQTTSELFKNNVYYIDPKIYQEEGDFNDFTLVFSGIAAASNNYSNSGLNNNLTYQTNQISQNLRFTLLYSVADNGYIGINIGNEQLIIAKDVNNANNTMKGYVDQNTFFIGASYKYDVKYLGLIQGLYPSIGTELDFATIGTIARASLGVVLKPEKQLSFGLYYEPTLLFNNYRDLSENYLKKNIVFSVSYRLK